MRIPRRLSGEAADFALQAHAGQIRKYTGEPYIVHPAEVAAMVEARGVREEVVAAAWLHDVVEDCEVSYDMLEAYFGKDVTHLVFELTDPSHPTLNRAARKKLSREFLACASVEAKTVKLADLISNTRSIVAHDPKFANVYLTEKRLLLPFLKEGDAELYERAHVQACGEQNVAA